MDDLEVVKACAERMGLPLRESGGRIEFRFPSPRGLNDWAPYDPLTNDAQAMALMRKFKLSVFKTEHGYSAGTGWNEELQTVTAFDGDPARAICLCVSQLAAPK